VESASATDAVLGFKMGQREGKLTFKLVDNKFMNFKSSVSDDMNFYIWKKAE
jgi:hypothetical protein